MTTGNGVSQQEAKFIIFSLGREKYGVAVGKVREIIKYPGVSVMPGTPPFLEGVIDLRGNIIPIFDLNKRFRQTATAVTAATRVIILELAARERVALLGVVVDGVDMVGTLPAAAIKEQPCLADGIRSKYVTGIGQHCGALVFLLDLDKLLTSDESGQLADVG